MNRSAGSAGVVSTPTVTATRTMPMPAGDLTRIVLSARTLKGVAGVEASGEGDLVRLRVRFGESLPDGDRAEATERCVAAAVGAGAGVREVRPAGGSLEDVFAALTAGESERAS